MISYFVSKLKNIAVVPKMLGRFLFCHVFLSSFELSLSLYLVKGIILEIKNDKSAFAVRLEQRERGERKWSTRIVNTEV